VLELWLSSLLPKHYLSKYIFISVGGIYGKKAVYTAFLQDKSVRKMKWNRNSKPFAIWGFEKVK
jgi:hypothetical protein